MKNIEINLKVGGHFKLRATKPNGEYRETDWQSNLFTNTGLDRLFLYGPTANAYLALGTGNTAPAVTDTNLVTEVATSSNVGSFVSAGNSGSAPYYGYARREYVFSVGTFADSTNLAELGIKYGSGGTLSTRALIVDSGGSPTTFTINSDEQLEVFYEFRLYAPTADVTGNVTNDADGSTVHAYTVRAENVDGSWNNFSTRLEYRSSCYLAAGAIAATTGAPSDKVSKTIGSDQGGYVNGTYELLYNFSFSTSQGNVSGGTVNTVGFHAGDVYFQIGLVPGFTKDNTKIASFNATVSIANYTP